MTVSRALVLSHSFLDRDPRVRRTVEALLDMGWEVDALVLDDSQRRGALRITQVPMSRERGSLLRHLLEYAVFFITAVGWITWRVIRGRADVVYVNSPPEAFVFAAIAAKLRRTPIILDIHDAMPELFEARGHTGGWLITLLAMQERWALRFADRVITVHDTLAELLWSRTPGARLDIVMNVPDTADLPPIEWDASSRILVYTGSIARRYGLDDVIRAIAEVRDDIPGIRLRLIGEGEDLAYLEDLAMSLGVADRLDYVGKVPHRDIGPAQADAWLGVNALKGGGFADIGFSNKVAEWAAMGLPVLSTRTKTVFRYFPEETLFYVEPDSPAEIAAMLRTIDAMDPNAIRSRTEAAARALAEIAWPVQAERLRSVLEEVNR